MGYKLIIATVIVQNSTVTLSSRVENIKGNHKHLSIKIVNKIGYGPIRQRQSLPTWNS